MAARRQLGGATAVPRSSAIVARQLSDFPITKLRFSPFDKRQLVSCGRENVRFWRISVSSEAVRAVECFNDTARLRAMC
eukprot:14002-Heterococcus_DN1.PRE.1